MAPHTDAPSSMHMHVPGNGWTAHPPSSRQGGNGVYSQPHYNTSFSSTSVDLSEDQPHRPLKAGVYVPTVTFFKKESEDLDLETIATHAVRMAKAGVAGLTTQGSNGEAVHLTHSERRAVTRATREALDREGFSHLPVMVGCGAQSTREAIELCSDALASGGDCALVLPPSYYKTLYKPQSTIDFFKDVATASPIPILIYNYPGAVSGIDLDSDTIIELSKHPNIIGCKLTCGNTGKLNRIAAATKAVTPTDEGSGFLCMGGSADFTMQTLIGGGSGIIGGLANVTPKACVKLINLYKSGKIEEAKALQAAVARGDWIVIQGGVVGTKSAMESHFGYGGYARNPLPKPTKLEIARIAEDFQELIGIEKRL